MLKKLKLLVITAATVGLSAIPMLAPAVAHAQTDDQTVKDAVRCGTELQFTTSNRDCSASEGDPEGRANGIIKLIINVFSVIVGVVAVIMIIVGGLKYITSGGDSSNITSAKNTILYAVIGLIVVALAQFIVRFVLKRVVDAPAA